MRNCFVSLLIVLLCGFAVTAQNGSKKVSSSIQRDLAEINKSFKYKGKAIHPRAIKDLTSWVTDPLPGPIAVDMEGTFDTNRYFGNYETRDDGMVFIDLTQEYVKDIGWFSYKHLGRLANGYHVLRTYDNGGGSGIFENILLVEGMVDYEYAGGGKRKAQLTLRRRGEFGIGDRYDGQIKIDAKHNTITVGADKQNIEKPYWIRIH